MKTGILFVLGSTGALLAYVASNLLQTLRPFQTPPPPNDASHCRLADGPLGAEDLVVTPSGRWIISSALDYHHLGEHGVDACGKNVGAGGLWALSISNVDQTTRPHRLALKGLPNDWNECFFTHGLYLSQETKRLYVVTHRGNASSIQIFNVQENDDQDQEAQLPTLTWIRAVTSPSFVNAGLNDVVEGATDGELYVTQWLPFGFPEHGRRNPANLFERIQQATLVPIFLLGLRTTTIHHCSFDSENAGIPAVCRLATNQRFGAANGITITSDRTRVYVNDAPVREVTEFLRDATTGLLTRTDTIALEYVGDNLHWSADGKTDAEYLWLGAITEFSKLPVNDGKAYEERLTVAGGLGVIERHNSRDAVWKYRTVYEHDGSKLSQISSGLLCNEKVYLGSPYSSGILVCDAPDKYTEKIR